MLEIKGKMVLIFAGLSDKLPPMPIKEMTPEHEVYLRERIKGSPLNQKVKKGGDPSSQEDHPLSLRPEIDHEIDSD